MPGLIAFRRRWATGSDDLVVPALLLFFLHITMFVVIAILITTSSELDYLTGYDLDYLENAQPKNYSLIEQVKYATEVRNYSLAYLVLTAFASVLEMILTCFSMKGTIADPSPRKPIQYVLYIRIAFGAIEVGLSIVASVLLAKHWNPSGVVQHLNNMLIAIIAINISVFVIVVCVGYCVFDPAGGEYYDAVSAIDRESTSWSTVDQRRKEFNEKSRKTWLNRLNSCFCCVSSNQSNMKQVALDEVSTLLYNFFKDYDFVLSDVVAGLTLLRHKQQRNEADTTELDTNEVTQFMSGRPITPNTHFLDLNNQETRQECEQLSYYCSYAVAAYGPLFFWMENLGTGPCKILKECMCVKNSTVSCPCCVRHRISRTHRAIVRSDEGCGWTHAAIRKSLGDHGVNADIVYLSLANELYQQPFYLSVDHERKAVVLAIRGTLGDEDALTDMVANGEVIDTEESDETWKAHKGMLMGAEFIKSKLLDEDMVLSLGFGHCLAKGTRDYKLIIVGHSLGAGVASILAILLHPIYPNLQCYAFSPPGGLFSQSAMLASKGYIRTLILGKDVIPRMGIPQLESLRNEVVELLKKTRLPKYKIILSNICGSLDRNNVSPQRNNPSRRAIRNSLVLTSTTSDSPSTTISEPLYLPGVIFHLVYTKEVIPGCRSSTKKRYYVVYGDNITEFQHIIVSHEMVMHHMPNEVWNCMKEALECDCTMHNSENAYARAETLPFNENRLLRVPDKVQPNQATSFDVHCAGPSRSRNGNVEASSTNPVTTQPISVIDDQTGNLANINDAIVSSSSSDFSLSSIPDADAPLARPESCTLSSTASALHR